MKARQLDLFGEGTVPVQRKKCRDEVFRDYESYVRKFRDVPKTTDDTFTPPDVFEAVLEWLKGKGKITDGTPVVRPFYPGGDFETADYPDGCVMVDNPPFSLFAKCCKWYTARRVPFFLFGPGLTIAQVADFCTCIVTDTGIKFENGARIPVSFASNMFGGAAAIAAGDLTQMLNGCESQREKANAVRRVEWPDGIVTVSELRTIAGGGGTFELHRECCEAVSSIGNEKLFGKAWLSGQYAEAAKAAKAAKAKREAAIQAAKAAKAAKAEQVELLPSEKETLERLCRVFRGKAENAPKIQGEERH